MGNVRKGMFIEDSVKERNKADKMVSSFAKLRKKSSRFMYFVSTKEYPMGFWTDRPEKYGFKKKGLRKKKY